MMEVFSQLSEHNVKYVFIFTTVYWCASSIISQQVFAGYIYVLTGSNAPVGVVKGIQGLFQLIFAFPAGYAADHFRRDRVLASAGVIGIVASLLTAFAFETGNLKLIYAAFALWGTFLTVQGPALEAIFADSVPSGQRSRPFTLKHMTMNAALVVGPLITILLFVVYGDTWKLPALRAIVLFGSFVLCLAMVPLFQFDDDQAFENKQYVLAVERELCSIERHFDAEMSDCLELEDTEAPAEGETSDGEDKGFYAATRTPVAVGEHSSLLLGSPGPIGGSLYMATPVEDPQDDPAQPRKFRSWLGLQPEHVPYVLFVSDFIISNGAGMTVNFFPLFFYKEFALTPIQVNAMFVLQPIAIAAMSWLAQLASRWFGRMPVVVWTRAIGTLSLLAMALSPSLQAECVLFVLRAATIQCSEPLRRSILMDFVPKKQRARWNSLEGMCMASWAGSAVMGGFLVEAQGYRFCFFIASFAYVAGTLLEMLLIPITKHAVEIDVRAEEVRLGASRSECQWISFATQNGGKNSIVQNHGY